VDLIHQGWFGSLTGMKYVFPTTVLENNHWFISHFKKGCGLNDDCAYDISDIKE